MTLHPMSLDQPDCVLAALDILCNVRWQALQPYHAKVFRALQKLQVFIKNHEPSPSDKSNDDAASPCSGPDSPRSSSDNNDLPSLPDHSDSSCAASNSHDPPSPSRPPRSPSILYNHLDPPTISDHSDASQAFSTKHDYPQPCSLAAFQTTFAFCHLFQIFTAYHVPSIPISQHILRTTANALWMITAIHHITKIH